MIIVLFIVENRVSTAVQWDAVTPEDWSLGIRISVTHFKEIKQVRFKLSTSYKYTNHTLFLF